MHFVLQNSYSTHCSARQCLFLWTIDITTLSLASGLGSVIILRHIWSQPSCHVLIPGCDDGLDDITHARATLVTAPGNSLVFSLHDPVQGQFSLSFQMDWKYKSMVKLHVHVQHVHHVQVHVQYIMYILEQ